MATLAAAKISDHSLEKSLCNLKDDGRDDHGTQPEKPKEQEESSIYNNKEADVKGEQAKKSSMSSEEAALQVAPTPTDSSTSSCVGKGNDAGDDESGRERLKRHRTEMGGRVWIPDTWGQENLLKNWIDCTSFDASLVNHSILSARAALMQRRATTRSTNNLTLHRRIQINRC